jgi:thioredoxin reductase (NADPH)
VEEEPVFLETSQPGVSAVGDVHCDSVKRVASAVGEGSMAVRLTHQRLSMP